MSSAAARRPSGQPKPGANSGPKPKPRSQPKRRSRSKPRSPANAQSQDAVEPQPAPQRRPRSGRRSRPEASPAPVGAAGRLKDRLPVSYHLVWVTSAVLLIAGLCMMLSISTAVTSGDRFAYLRNQGITAAVGVVVLVLLSRADYRRLRTWSVALLALVVAALLAVHIPGMARSEGGSASWIPLGPLTLQPSEFAKLAVVLLGAHILTSRRVSDGRLWSYMWPFGVVSVVMCGLVFLEGDLGTAVIIAGLLLGMLWMGGIRGRHWLLVTSVGCVGALGLVLLNSHRLSERLSRVLSFIDPWADPEGSSYQLVQSLVALGRGGWFGVGPGESVQKFQYLPNARSDMVFAILGEEFGLVGAGLVIILFAVFAVGCWRLTRRCADPMGKLLIAGCGMLVVLQAVINIGGVTGALPLTGVPLPFMSYGRNSLLVMFIAVGLILAVCRRAPATAARSRVERNENVTHIDRRRWDGGARGARVGAR